MARRRADPRGRGDDGRVILHLRAAVDLLYAAPVERFIGLRGELVAQARAAGERDLARDVGRLRKPTVAAWALNHVARQRPGVLDALGDYARDLREAQRTLDADRLRSLGRERGARVEEAARAVEEAARTEGVTLGASVAAEVGDSLTACVVDEDAERAVRSGALVRPLAYSGFGSVEIEGAVALAQDADGAGREGPAATVADLAHRSRTRREAERAALVRGLDDARRSGDRAEDRVAALEVRRDDARAGVEDLERRLEAARTRLEGLSAQLEEAARERELLRGREEDAQEDLRAFDAETGRTPEAP